MSPDPYALLTGATGFLGPYLKRGLESDGYKVITLGRGNRNTVSCDLSCSSPDLVGRPSPALVVHAAGKAHSVPKTAYEKRAFFKVNEQGTEHLLEGLERSNRIPESLVFISTVAVYGRETGEKINEMYPLEARDPYGLSKIRAEERLLSWGRFNGVGIGILRLPLVAGRNPPGNLGAMIRAISGGYYARLGNGAARRAWVWAEDVARVVGAVAQKSGIYNLTDGRDPTFREIEDALAASLGKSIRFTLPMLPARMLARSGDLVKALGIKMFPFDSRRLAKMTGSLTFSSLRAQKELAWRPTPILENMEKVFHEG